MESLATTNQLAMAHHMCDHIYLAYVKARTKHKPMRGPHEGYAVLLEEMDELWEEVRAWQPDAPNAEKLRKEALHVAAMALAFLVEGVEYGP